MNTAKFQVGEVVMIRSAYQPTRNVDATTILAVEWHEGPSVHCGFYVGWLYETAAHKGDWCVEQSLRKRPKPADQSWEEMHKQLTKNVPDLVT